MRSKLTKYPLVAVFSTIFIDLLAVGILIPVFPLLILPNSPERITPDYWTISSGFILLGWLSASYPIMQFFATPILGEISDRWGRKIVLIISVIGTSISYVLFAIAIITKNIPLLFFSRAFDGITGGNISVAQAVISDISTPKNRARNFGLVGMAFGLGFILGPYIGGKLADPKVVSWFDASTPFWFAAGLSLFNVLLITLFLPETLKERSKKFRLHLFKSVQNVIAAFTKRGLRHVVPSTFLFNGGFTFFTTFFAVYLASEFNFTQGNTGDYFAYIGLWIAIVQGFVTAQVAKKFKDWQVLRFSMFGMAIALLGYMAVPAGEYKWLFFVAPLVALFSGLTQAFIPTIVSRVTPRNIQGEALGINASVAALSQTFPAILSGYVATINQHLPVTVGAGFIAAAGIVFWILYKPGIDDA